jgi:hypothetical protein
VAVRGARATAGDAKGLGLEVPLGLSAGADEVIE